MKIGKTIQSIRMEHQLSQEQFAQIFHVTRQTISNWENEKSYPDLQSLINMSERFQLSLDDMLKDSPEIVRRMDKRKYVIRWMLLSIAVLILLLLGILLFAFEPTPHHRRNLPDHLPTMYLNLPQATPSRAIVRSFTEEEFEKLSSNRLRTIYDTVDGRMEGDIPPLRLQEGKELRFVFQNTQRDNMSLTETPFIRVYSEGKTVYEGNLILDEMGWYLLVDASWVEKNTVLYLECHYEDTVSLTAVYLVP